jgi:cell wall-associated NlpC family hydrolase
MSSLPRRKHRFSGPRVLAMGVAAVMLLNACGHEQVRRVPASGSSATVPHSASTQGRAQSGEQAAVIAVRQIGIPYRYGGSTTEGFDCSGLVQYAYAKAGTHIPRTTAQQWQQLRPIGKDKLRVGDLLFFNIDGKIAHVGLYLGSRRFVHAPASGREVSIAELDSGYYRQAFVRGGRPD